MFSTISWGDYITLTAGILLCYYAGVVLLYYRTEIRSLLAGRNKHSVDNYTADEITEGASTKSSEVLTEIYSILQEAGPEASKPELLDRINVVLAEYDGLRIPAYRSAIHDYIIREGKTICGVGIREEELRG